MTEARAERTRQGLATSFCEYADTKPRKTPIFALSERIGPCSRSRGSRRPGKACAAQRARRSIGESGRVIDPPLADIWRHSTVLEEIRGASVQNKEKCASCHLKFVCAGGSPCSSHFASLANQGRSDLRAAEPYCGTFMDLTHGMLWELGLAGVDGKAPAGEYPPPRLFNATDGAGAHCARPNTKAIDRAFEVGSYHCVCVLESDVPEGAPIVAKIPADADPRAPAASFDAIGRACVELLLPMANQVRALEVGQVLKVTTDDPAASEDLELLVPDERQRTGRPGQGRRLREVLYRKSDGLPVLPREVNRRGPCGVGFARGTAARGRS